MLSINSGNLPSTSQFAGELAHHVADLVTDQRGELAGAVATGKSADIIVGKVAPAGAGQLSNVAVARSGAASANVGRRVRPSLLWARRAARLCLACVRFLAAHAHLREFDAPASRNSETRMWRSYYDKRYIALLCGSVRSGAAINMASLLRTVLPLRGTRRARREGVPTTRNRAEQSGRCRCSNALRVPREHGSETFDVDESARVELDWWQMRRENATAAEVGSVIIGGRTSVVFHQDNAEIRRAGLLRAEMI